MAEILSILVNNKLPRLTITSEIGDRGERLAADYLRANGYHLILANFKVPIGRNRTGASITGEIDIIALDGETLCFVEVKTRTSIDFAEPHANVTRRKQRQISRTARVYRRIFGLADLAYRYDVVSVILERGREPRIGLLKGFWSESKFRKKVWSGDIY
jgi:putative endonuclease